MGSSQTDDDFEDYFLFFALLYLKRKQQLQKIKHQWWIHEIIHKRRTFGSYYNLVKVRILKRQKLALGVYLCLVAWEISLRSLYIDVTLSQIITLTGLYGRKTNALTIVLR